MLLSFLDFLPSSCSIFISLSRFGTKTNSWLQHLPHKAFIIHWIIIGVTHTWRRFNSIPATTTNIYIYRERVNSDDNEYPSLRWTMVLGQPLLQRTWSLWLVPKVPHFGSNHQPLCPSCPTRSRCWLWQLRHVLLHSIHTHLFLFSVFDFFFFRSR